MVGTLSLCPPRGLRSPILMVRSAATPRVSNHVATLVPYILRDGAFAPPQSLTQKSLSAVGGGKSAGQKPDMGDE